MNDDNNQFNKFKIGGIYVPDTNIATIMCDLGSLGEDGIETYIHENVHRFQFSISTLGYVIRESWHLICGSIIELITSTKSKIKLPISCFLNELDENNNLDYETKKYLNIIKDQLNFLQSWNSFEANSKLNSCESFILIRRQRGQVFILDKLHAKRLVGFL